MTEATKHAPLSDEVVEAAARAVAADHYARRFGKAKDDAHVLVNVSSNWQIFSHDARIAIEGVLTLPIAQPAGVRVKPLQWGKTSYGTPEVITVVGVYRINAAALGGWTVTRGGLGALALRDADGRQNFPTLDSAKAAAQADYASSVLSAIEAAPPTQRADQFDDANELVGHLIDVINDELIEADVDYPAGREAGHSISYDEVRMRAALISALTDARVGPAESATSDGISPKPEGIACSNRGGEADGSA